MSLKSKYQLMDIPINEIHESDWGVRHTAAATVEEEKDYDGLNGLTKSILTDGLLSPIIVNPIDQGFEVIAGRRRLKACKNARIEKIPSFVILDKNWTKADLHRITYAENVFRKDLKDLDKSYGILKRFQDYGYTPDQTIKGVKSIDNWFSDHTNNKTDWDALLHNLVMEKKTVKKGPPANPLRYDKKFVEICKDIGYSPKYQYQFLQLIIQVREDIMEKAEEEGLSTKKKILLTHSKLRKYPQLQKNLIEKIKDKKIDEHKARNIVHQTINDIETGYLRPSETGKTFIYGDPLKRDLINGNKNEAKSPEDHYMDMHTEIKKLLFHLTGYSLSRGETKYTEEMIKNTNTHRLNIVKTLNTEYKSLYGFYKWYINPLKLAIDDMHKKLNDEMDSLEQKKEMIKE